MYRKTYAEIDGDILTNNIKEITKKYNDYQYYIGVVKNNAYNHGIYVVNNLIAGGINYLAVSSFEECLQIRKYNNEIPILCLEPIDIEYIYDCINNGITITVESLKYLEDLMKLEIKDKLNIHLKIDSGMNRLGFKKRQEVKSAYELINNAKYLYLEGIYSHFATSGISDPFWDIQLKNFEELTKDIDLKTIPIVHLGRSLTLVNHPKISFCNGIRLGIIMFGFNQSLPEEKFYQKMKKNYLTNKYNISPTTRQNDLKLKTAFVLKTKVMSIRKVLPNEFVGYGANILIKEEMDVATLPIGYADGVTKAFKYVWINNELCDILADSMDMLMVKVKKNTKIGDEVEIFGHNISIKDVTSRLNINAYHLFNQISSRVVRLHLSKGVKDEIKY